jgi:hypothetical protein
MTMSVRSDLTELKMMEAAMEIDASSMAALPTFAAVFAYVAASAKAGGRDPAHDVELLARHGGLSASEARRVAVSLCQLGFKAPADRLFQIAGRRRVDLRPLAQ